MLRVVLNLCSGALYVAGLSLYGLTVLGGYCTVLSVLPLWFLWQLSSAGCSIARHLVLDDALTVASAAWYHDYRRRSPKDVAVTGLIQLERRRLLLSRRREQIGCRYRRLHDMIDGGDRALVGLADPFGDAALVSAALHREPPLRRLALCVTITQICTPSPLQPHSRPNPTNRLLRPGLISLAVSLLPTPLALLSDREELNLSTVFLLIPSLISLVIALSRLHALIILYRLFGGQPLSVKSLGEDKQLASVKEYGWKLEALSKESFRHGLPAPGSSVLSLLKKCSQWYFLLAELDRLEEESHEALLLTLHRWKDERDRVVID